MAFVWFIGVLLFFLSCKFFYDTYITNNTKNSWNEFRQNNPENASRIERNKGLDFSMEAKSSKKDKEDSLEQISERLNCLTSEAEKYFILSLKNDRFTYLDTTEFLKSIKIEKYKESKKRNIDPDDTVSSYLEGFTKKYLNNLEYKYIKRTLKEVREDFKVDNPSLKEIIESGDKEALDSFANDHPNLINNYREEIIIANNLENFYLLRGSREILKEENYSKGLEIVELAFKYDKSPQHHYLYYLKSLCQKNLNQLQESLLNCNKAIELNKQSPNPDYNDLSVNLALRAEIKNLLGDSAGHDRDIERSAEYDII